MKRQSLKRQAAVVGAAGIMVRGIGFCMRLWLARLLGAEAMGLMEMTASLHLLALTPGAYGLSGAIGRLTARSRDRREQRQIAGAGKQLALIQGLLLVPLYGLLVPLAARLLGDVRAMPALFIYAPCVLFCGLCSVYHGACYGRNHPWPPAAGELAEQLTRLFVTVSLLHLLPSLTVAGLAAVPAIGAAAGHVSGLLLTAALSAAAFAGDESSLPPSQAGNGPSVPLLSTKKAAELTGLRRKIRGLALPLMASQLAHAGLHALSGVLIPGRLMAAGLPRSEAMSRLGMLSGMVMPLMLIPGLLAGALATVGSPAMARCTGRKAQLRLARRLLLPALGAGLLWAGSLYGLAPWLAFFLYRLPELTPLIRALCPMAVLLPLQQVTSGLLTGLGLQKKALTASLWGAGLTVLGIFFWTPSLGILGSGLASMAGHLLTLLCCLRALTAPEKEPQRFPQTAVLN